MRRLLPFLTLLMLGACAPRLHLSDLVDTSVGVTDKHSSNCVIGPMLPYGSINPSPQSAKGTSDGYEPRMPIRGFGQMHVSGTGWPTYGNFLISPMTGLSTGLLDHESEHSDLVTRPYLFKTVLERYGITAELAPAHYSAIYRLTFPQADTASVVFDAIHSIAGDIFPKAAKTVLGGSSEIDPDSGTIRMTVNMTGGWPEQPHQLWCVARISRTDWSGWGSWAAEEYGSKERRGIVTAGAGVPDIPHQDLAFDYGNYPEQRAISAIPGCNDHVGSYVSFATGEGEQVLVKLACSFNGFENAEALLDAEIPDWDFDRVRDEARRTWDRKLEAVKVDMKALRRSCRYALKTEADSVGAAGQTVLPEGPLKGLSAQAADELTFFYTSLYRLFTFAHERTLDRPAGEAYPTDTEVFDREDSRPAQGSGLPYWDDNYAYWDTFRTAYPMLLLLDQEAWRSNLEALIGRFETRGGVWDSFVAGQDRKTDQGGNDVDHIIVDGFVKNVPGIDWERAYAIIKHDADSMRIGKSPAEPWTGEGPAPHLRYKELGWIPATTMSSSQTLEFAYNDWCAAQMARALGHGEDADRWEERSGGWINLWNPVLESRGYRGFIDARTADGRFVGVDPAKFGGSWVSPFYEGRSWTYSYYVPHDMARVIELMGGADAFVERLNYGYEARLTEYDNEPGFLTVRAFTDAGRPDLSSYWVRRLMRDKFSCAKGYPDNEDTGSMGSWYVFCALGFFPDAGQDFYYLNAPLFPRVSLRLPGGRRLRIKCNASPDNVVIRSCSLGGRALEGSSTVSHSDLVRGGTLKMELGQFEP